MNKALLIGRLPQDPEARVTASGRPVTNFSVACNYQTAAGEQTDFVDCVAWGKLAETVATYVTKGRKVAVEGRISVRRFTGQDGQTRKIVEVVAVDVDFMDNAKPEGRTEGAADFGAFGEDVR